jgi:hypothetical protein
MTNSWSNHLKQFRTSNKSMTLKQAMKAASRTYKGGSPVPVESTSSLAKAADTLKGGGVTPFQGSSLASTAATVGGKRKSRSVKRSAKRSEKRSKSRRTSRR